MATTSTNQDDQKETLDGLSQLWARLPNPNQAPAAPSPLMQPGLPGGPPAPTDLLLARQSRVPLAPLPMAPAALPPAAPAPAAPTAAVPPPTDDPALGMARQRFQDTSTQFNSLLGQQRDLGNKIAGVPQIHRADYKPSIGREILGRVLAAIAGGGSGNVQFGADVGSNYINKPYSNAAEERNKTLAPFLAQQNAVERQIPLLNASNESAWREYQAGMGEKKENRLEAADQQKADYQNDFNDIRKMIGDNRHADAEARLNELSEKNKNNAAIQQQVADMRDRLADVRDRLATNQENKVANATDPNGWSPAEAREINQRQRPLTGNISALEHTRALLLAEGDKDGVGRIDAELGPLHEKLTDIENEVTGRRKSNQRQPGGGGGQPAAGGPPAILWRGIEIKVLSLKDSKGSTQKWQLVNGVPQPYNQGGK